MTDDNEKKAQQIRDRVERAQDDFVVARMRVHGFWPKGQPLPADPPDEASARQQLEGEKLQLLQQLGAPANADAALAAERLRRILESRQQRDCRNAARLEQARLRRQAWAVERVARVVHAGVGVSSDLNDVASNEGVR